jgi:hypothetical protein
MLCPSGGQVNATASVGGAAVDCAGEVIAGAGGADAVLDPQRARSSTRARSTRSTIRRSSKAKRRRQSRKMRRSSRRAFVHSSSTRSVHTFLTRLGESGCDAWTLARIAAHRSIAISSRLRASVRRCGPRCDGAAGWAQRRNARISRRKRASGSGTNGRGKLARPERFELPTYCSGGNRSIQLSYGRA